MEHLSNTIGQFFTLTLSEEGLSAFNPNQPRRLAKNFLTALRNSERRKGNPLSIRSFGVLEYGTELGRPHFHFLIWNHLNHVLPAEPYKENLPRIRHHLGLWPHGHIDACPLTPSSAQYVAKYVTKFNTDLNGIDPLQTPECIAFHANKPALGSNGLIMLLDEISRSPQRHWLQEPFISLDGRRWALDQTMLGHWLYHCRRLGLKYDYPTDQSERRLNTLLRNAERDDISWSDQLTRINRNAEKQRIYEYQHGEYQRKQDLLLSRALSACARAA